MRWLWPPHSKLAAESPSDFIHDAADRQADLFERVAIAQRDGSGGHRVAIDGDAPRGADLVLAAIALADRGLLSVNGGEAACFSSR